VNESGLLGFIKSLYFLNFNEGFYHLRVLEKMMLQELQYKVEFTFLLVLSSSADERYFRVVSEIYLISGRENNYMMN